MTGALLNPMGPAKLASHPPAPTPPPATPAATPIAATAVVVEEEEVAGSSLMPKNRPRVFWVRACRGAGQRDSA